MCFILPLKFLQRCLWNDSRTGQTDDGLFGWILLRQDQGLFPLSLPHSSWQLMVWCPWLCANRWCLKLLNISARGRQGSYSVLAAFLDVFSSGLQWGVYTVRFTARINVWPTAVQYTPNSTAARRNWRRRLHSSCRQDSQCSGDWEEEARGDPWLGVHSQGNMNGESFEKNRS